MVLLGVDQRQSRLYRYRSLLLIVASCLRTPREEPEVRDVDTLLELCFHCRFQDLQPCALGQPLLVGSGKRAEVHRRAEPVGHDAGLVGILDRDERETARSQPANDSLMA
jgi:hypothetical protein